MGGGSGGELRIAIGLTSARGNVFVPPAINVAPPIDVRFTEVRVTAAANGGHAIQPTQLGGKGGDVIIEGTFGGATANARVAVLDKVSDGGIGYDGCAVRPKRNGTNGGPAGKLKRGSLPLQHKDSFNGGFGGDGNPTPGTGGTEGRDVDDNNRPIGSPGGDGRDCPDYLGLAPTPPSFNHIISETGCPQLVASPALTNTSQVAVTYTATVTGTSALVFGNANGTLQPGSSTTLPLSFNCSTTNSFNATLQVTAAPLSGNGTPQLISVPITGVLSYWAVELNHQTGPYAPGTVIPLSRIVNYSRVGIHIPFCSYEHLHALSPQGIQIRDVAGVSGGPFPDPETGGCGYGKIWEITQPVASATEDAVPSIPRNGDQPALSAHPPR
jgi:hypothetical protein